MALMSDNKQKELEDTLTILATNMEVINQRLAMTRPEYGLTEYLAVMQKNLDALKKQFDSLSDKVKTSEMNLQELISYGLKQNETIFKHLQESQSRIIKTFNEQIVEIHGSIKAATETMTNKLQESTFATRIAIQSINSLKNDLQSVAGTLDSDMVNAMKSSETALAGEMNKLESGMRGLLDSFHGTVARAVTDSKAGQNVKGEMDSLKRELYNLVQRYNLTMVRGMQAGGTDDVKKAIDALKSDMRDMLDRFNQFIGRGTEKGASPTIRREMDNLKHELTSLVENYNNSVQKTLKGSQPQSPMAAEVKALNIKLDILSNILEDLVKTHQEFVRYLETDQKYNKYHDELRKLRQA